MSVVNESLFDLPPQEIHVWSVQPGLFEFDVQQLSRWLRFDELERADRFAFTHLKRRFVIRRAALRILLGRYTGASNNEIRFGEIANGKPRLVGPVSNGSFEFNVSHSQDAILIAIARQPVGIDLEKVQLLTDLDAMTARTLSPREQGSLGRLSKPERLAGFYKLWTCKEAVLKATGEGLSISLSSVEINFGDSISLSSVEINFGDEVTPSSSTVVFQNGTAWNVGSFQPFPGFAAAIAFENANSDVVFRDFAMLREHLTLPD